jgi:hypothetical protein
MSSKMKTSFFAGNNLPKDKRLLATQESVGRLAIENRL